MAHLSLVRSPDQVREARINELNREFGRTKSHTRRHEIMQEIYSLRAQRSPEFVEQMERNKGLLK